MRWKTNFLAFTAVLFLFGASPVLSMKFEKKEEDSKEDLSHHLSHLSLESTEKSLDFSGWGDLTDEIFRVALEPNPLITRLNMQGCTQVTEVSFRLVAKSLTQLEELDLTGCLQLTPITLEFILERLKPSLKKIGLSGIPWVTCGTFLNLQKRGLTFSPENGADDSLDCSYQLLDDEELGERLKRYPYIQTLHLKGCRFITNASLQSIETLKDLQLLDLRECIQLTPSVVEPFVSKMSLKWVGGNPFVLDFSSKPAITDTECIDILTKSTNIHILNVSGCVKLTDITLTFLEQKIKNLTSLSIAWCPGFTNTGFASVVKMQNLRSLNLLGCAWLTDENVASISQLTALTSLSIGVWPSLRTLPGTLAQFVGQLKLKELCMPRLYAAVKPGKFFLLRVFPTVTWL